MAHATSRNATPAKDKQRKPSSSKESKLITLKVSVDKLRAIMDPTYQPAAKEDTPMQDIKESPGASTPQPAPAAESNPDLASESSLATPANGGTPVPPAMGPPDNKKKGVKRSAAAVNGEGAAKVRGKPGPKKRQRM